MATSRSQIIFSVLHKCGTLKSALSTIESGGINLKRIFSRPSRTKSTYDIIVDIDDETPKDKIDFVLKELKKTCQHVKFVGGEETPWFPRKIQDLDLINRKILEAGGELQADHPGFKDTVYRNRRREIADIAINYKYGEPIPRIKYTEQEKKTWELIYNKLTALYPTHACKQLNYVFPLLEENCGYSAKEIPQLEDVSNFLKDATGFTIRPVAGLLSARDFLNGLAFRVFHSTQYIRHHSEPFYTPEPDVVHELMGHVPLLADPEFADFSQEIGLASLGASDEVIEQLVRCYWYTIEFGIYEEGNEKRAYGAGLLSSFGELEYCLTDKPQFLPFDPYVCSQKPYPITTYQPVYYVTKSFEELKKKMRDFANSLERDFALRYNPFTLSIEILDSRKKLLNLCENLTSDLRTLQSAIQKIDGELLDEPLD